MARIVLSEFLTLDGVMQAPGGEDEDPSGGFEHGGWQDFDDAVGRAVDEAMATTDALLLGRRTYDIFAGYWPTSTEEPGLAETLNSLPKYVVSTTLEEPLAWSNSTLIKEDVPSQLAKLKELPLRDILVFGSGVLAQTLMQHDLVDEYRLMVHSVVLGSGMRLFREGSPRTPLQLVRSETSPSGTMILIYEPAPKE